jgi:tRNA G18 (ribose-2'-O)-methylase SpoU
MDLSIPTVSVESLNAAIAAGILLYEAQRQRALRS